jgi:hypothetical protein
MVVTYDDDPNMIPAWNTDQLFPESSLTTWPARARRIERLNDAVESPETAPTREPRRSMPAIFRESPETAGAAYVDAERQRKDAINAKARARRYAAYQLRIQNGQRKLRGPRPQGA